jgi:site-specific DNA recombinase
VVDELDKPEFLDAIAADEYGARRDAITDALDALGWQRGELAAMWATPGEVTDTEWKTALRAGRERTAATGASWPSGHHP